jgi:hypothetical protein
MIQRIVAKRKLVNDLSKFVPEQTSLALSGVIKESGFDSLKWPVIAV